MQSVNCCFYRLWVYRLDLPPQFVFLFFPENTKIKKRACETYSNINYNCSVKGEDGELT